MKTETLKKKSLLTVVLTLVTMVGEIYYGIVSNSMALTADGIHMGTHAAALFITYIFCCLALRYTDKADKMNAIGGNINAILLLLTGFAVIYESVGRFINPLTISFSEAILVTIIGMAVNVVCIMIMGGEGHHHNHQQEHHHHDDEKDENVNYKAAYLHIAADLMTSVLALVALFSGRYLGWVFLDPLMGIVGGVLILRWAFGLLKTSCKTIIACGSNA